jgi:hypothetical protein
MLALIVLSSLVVRMLVVRMLALLMPALVVLARRMRINNPSTFLPAKIQQYQ